MTLDIDFVRAQFPAFSEPSLADLAFFENAGGSYTCRQVVDRLFRFYTQRKVQPYGPFEASHLAGAEMDEARARLAAMLGVATDELSFGPSTSQNTYVLASAFGQMLQPGDAIVVSTGRRLWSTCRRTVRRVGRTDFGDCQKNLRSMLITGSKLLPFFVLQEVFSIEIDVDNQARQIDLSQTAIRSLVLLYGKI